MRERDHIRPASTGAAATRAKRSPDPSPPASICAIGSLESSNGRSDAFEYTSFILHFFGRDGLGCRIQIQLDSKSSKSTGFQLDLVCVIENPVEITWSDPYYRYTYTQFEGAARGRSAAR
mgnify:CR=1 FL=1